MSPVARLLVRFIDRYQAAGGGEQLFWVACDFTPKCSAYTRDAIVKHGALKGCRLGWRRIRRCRGHSRTPIEDPVPEQGGEP